MNSYTSWEYSTYNTEVRRSVEISFNDPSERAALTRVTLCSKKDDIVTVSRTDFNTILPFIRTARHRTFDIRVTGYNSYEKIHLHVDTGTRLTPASWQAIVVYGTVLLSVAFILL